MSRGFRSKANKERDALLEQMRVRYLSALAWRRAAWLAERHSRREDVRHELRRIMPADRDQALADDAAALESDRLEAWLGIVLWLPFTRVPIRGFEGLKWPSFTSHDEGNQAIA